MKVSINQIEAEQFTISALAFISEQAERFNTSEEFIEQALLGLIDLMAQKRKEEK